MDLPNFCCLANAARAISSLALRVIAPILFTTTCWVIVYAASASTDLSPDAARALDAKIRSLTSPERAQEQSFQPVVISELEANSYLKYRGQEFLPKGLNNPEIHITAPDSVTMQALVDFSELDQGSSGKSDQSSQILNWILSGKQQVSTTGKLATGNGQGKVTIDKVTIGNTTVPQILVDYLLQSYLPTRYKIDLSKPFDLPDHVTRIALSSGRATFFRSPSKGSGTSLLTK